MTTDLSATSINKYWQERWRAGNTKFHQSDYNVPMVECFSLLDLKQGDEVFVPLCGKSSDILWLVEQGYRVLGNELSSIAAKAFFVENDLPFTKILDEYFTVYQGDSVTILQGNYFDLQEHYLCSVSGVYDRAALVALPSEEREKYIQHQLSFLPKSAKIFLLNIEYLPEELNGPPYCVPEAEVTQKYSKRFNNISIIKEYDGKLLNPHLNAKSLNPNGLSFLKEKVFLIK